LATTPSPDVTAGAARRNDTRTSFAYDMYGGRPDSAHA
jgi:hypothetical protein